MADGNDLIAAIYDAVIDPSRWNEVVRRIVAATKSLSGGIITKPPDAIRLSSLCNIDPTCAEAYIQTYAKMDPLAVLAPAIAPGKVRTGTLFSQTDDFKASTLHNEFCRPQGWADVVAVGLVRTPQATGILNLQRTSDALWVEEPEWHLLESLAPQLRRAAQLRQLLSQARTLTESLGAAVAGAGFAVLLLAGDCRILFANTRAEDLLHHGAVLRCEFGRLVAATPALTHRSTLS